MRKRSKRYPGLYKPPNSEYWSYRFTVGGKRISRTTGETDQRAAWERASRMREEHKQRAADPYREHADRPVTEHVADWQRALEAGGCTAQHVDTVVGRVKRLVKGCKVSRFADIRPADVQAYLVKLRKDDERNKKGRGFGTRTRNFYLKAAKQFCRWMVAERRARENPLAHLKGERGLQADLRRARDAFSEAELGRLLARVPHRGISYGLTGAERARLYRLAAETGLRAGELRTLTWAAIDTGPQPMLTVRASYSKNGEARSVPLRAETAALLEAQRAGSEASADARALRMPDPCNLARMLKADLEALKIPYRTTEGRYRDFHSFRHTFASRLARAGTPVKTAQDLLGHKTVAMTLEIYSHTVLADHAAAIERAIPGTPNPVADAG